MSERAWTDDDVEPWWRSIGLPGLIDAHVHFMPARVTERVWEYFDRAGPLTARPWPIHYRWPEQRRLQHLRSMGVRAFPSLLYPHKPGMAEWLNAWAGEFARVHPDVLSTATFFPEEGAAGYVEAALSSGVRVFKAHLQVGDYDPRDPLLDRVWGVLAEAAVPVVVHAGGGPVPGRFTGPGPFGEVLARHPTLTAVIAHMGAPEHEEFLGYVERYRNVYVDTTMCFVRWFEQSVDPPAQRVASLGEKILFGTDFPNIPYPYVRQLQALVELGLGETWLRAVCWHNAARLFGVREPASPDG